jgi:hypothetical protein
MTVTIATQERIRGEVEKAFNFDVEKFPLSGPDNMKTGVYGLFRSDNQQFVGSASVTKQYHPHTKDDVCALAEAGSSLFEGEAVVKCHWRDGHYVTVQPTNEYRHNVYGTNDGVFPRIVINAGYDKTSFGASMGYYRDACRNLAMLQRVQGTSVSIRHTPCLREQINQLITQFQAMSGGWQAMTDHIDRMERSRVSVRDFLQEMYGDVPESGKSKTMHENRTRLIVDRIIRERVALAKANPYDLSQATGWELFNGVGGYQQHDSIVRPRKGTTLTDMDRIIMAMRHKDLQKAENLVFELSA